MELLVSSVDIAYIDLALVKNNEIVQKKRFEVSPEKMLQAVFNFLGEADLVVGELGGILVVTGPGSVTALRAGISVVNALAFANELPIKGIENKERQELEGLLIEFAAAKTQSFVVPAYGRDPNITTSKK